MWGISKIKNPKKTFDEILANHYKLELNTRERSRIYNIMKGLEGLLSAYTNPETNNFFREKAKENFGKRYGKVKPLFEENFKNKMFKLRNGSILEL